MSFPCLPQFPGQHSSNTQRSLCPAQPELDTVRGWAQVVALERGQGRHQRSSTTIRLGARRQLQAGETQVQAPGTQSKMHSGDTLWQVTQTLASLTVTGRSVLVSWAVASRRQGHLPAHLLPLLDPCSVNTAVIRARFTRWSLSNSGRKEGFPLPYNPVQTQKLCFLGSTKATSPTLN